MKLTYAIILFFVLVSCKPKEKEHGQNNVFAQDNDNITGNLSINNSNDGLINNNYNDELIDIEFDVTEIGLARMNDNDMIQNVTAIYRSESDAIKNKNEIEPNQKVMEVLDKPFEKSDLSIFSEYSKNALYNGINELLNYLGINLSKNKIEEFDSIREYRNIKIKIENLNIYIYKQYNKYKLFFVEYNGDLSFEPKLKITFNKNDIINLLGNPSAYSDDRNIFIYNSNESLRQINIYFDNENVKFVQLISWGGI